MSDQTEDERGREKEERAGKREKEGTKALRKGGDKLDGGGGEIGEERREDIINRTEGNGVREREGEGWT